MLALMSFIFFSYTYEHGYFTSNTHFFPIDSPVNQQLLDHACPTFIDGKFVFTWLGKYIINHSFCTKEIHKGGGKTTSHFKKRKAKGHDLCPVAYGVHTRISS